MACRSRLQVGRERTSWCRRSLRGFSSMLDAAVIGRSRSQADVSLKLFGTIRTEPCRKRTANRTRRLLACRALISHFYYSTRHTQPAPPPPRKGTVWGGNTTPELQAMTGMTIASAACTPQRAWSLPRQRRNFPQLPSALYVPSFHNFLFPSILELFFFLVSPPAIERLCFCFSPGSQPSDSSITRYEYARFGCHLGHTASVRRHVAPLSRPRRHDPSGGRKG